jgi:N-acyl homoserine lactone hydrolase
MARTGALLAMLSLTGLGLTLTTCLASPLARPPPLTLALPPSRSPASMAVFRLPTGVIHRTAAFAYRGGSFFDPRDFAATAVLVRHPRGDLLIDTGFGRQIDAQFANMPALFRAITRYEPMESAADRLQRAGYDRTALRGILLTHAHWDHVSGIPDFPGLPVLLPRAERSFVDSGGASSALVRSFQGVRYEPYDFEGGPYLNFAHSHDLYGDGSVVIVLAAGHTPGSVIVFLTAARGPRFALVGDLVWQLEAVRAREERPWFARAMVDTEREGVRDNLSRVAALAARFPELVIVPAHDQRGFAKMPLLAP